MALDQAECLDQGGSDNNCNCGATARQFWPHNQHSHGQEDPGGSFCHQEYDEGNTVNINHGRHLLPPNTATHAVRAIIASDVS